MIILSVDVHHFKKKKNKTLTSMRLKPLAQCVGPSCVLSWTGPALTQPPFLQLLTAHRPSWDQLLGLTSLSCLFQFLSQSHCLCSRKTSQRCPPQRQKLLAGISLAQLCLLTVTLAVLPHTPAALAPSPRTPESLAPCPALDLELESSTGEASGQDNGLGSRWLPIVLFLTLSFHYA